jgi:hypothetical protein
MNKPLFRYTPTGTLYKTREEAKEACEYGMHLQLDSYGLMSQTKPIDTRRLQPKKGWSRSNEPEEHLDQVAKDLSNQLTEREPRILLFSYKDTSLLKRINSIKSSYADYVFNDYNGLQNTTWPEDRNSVEVATRIDCQQSKYDLIICRHYLEHYEDPLIIIESMIGKLSGNGRIYVEVPDCSVFVKRKNPLFLWEQHKIYFTEKSLIALMNVAKLNCAMKKYGDSIEPSICCIMNRNKSLIHLREQREKYIQEIGRDIVDEYVRKWRAYFQRNKRRIILLGIGHNSDRFMQITRSEDNIHSLIDYDPDKAGFYVGKSTQAIINNIEAEASEDLEIILGVHDRSFNQIRKMLSKQYPNAKIRSIFQMYEF